jgi:hypothetical protein
MDVFGLRPFITYMSSGGEGRGGLYWGGGGDDGGMRCLILSADLMSNDDICESFSFSSLFHGGEKPQDGYYKKCPA